VGHEECPALAALSTLLRRRKEFLSKSEEIVEVSYLTSRGLKSTMDLLMILSGLIYCSGVII
jgi:hypothetical protein